MSSACWIDSPSPRTHWLICLHGKGKLISWSLYQKRPWKDNGKSIAFLTLNFSLKNRSMYQSKVRSQWQFQYFRKGRQPHKIKKKYRPWRGAPPDSPLDVNWARRPDSIGGSKGAAGTHAPLGLYFFKISSSFYEKIAKIIGCPAPPPLVDTTPRLWNPGSATEFHQRNEI